MDVAAVEAGFGRGAKHPVGTRVGDAIQVADRNIDPDPVILAAGLDQADAHRRIRRQAVGQQAASAAAADDHIVEFMSIHA